MWAAVQFVVTHKRSIFCVSHCCSYRQAISPQWRGLCMIFASFVFLDISNLLLLFLGLFFRAAYSSVRHRPVDLSSNCFPTYCCCSTCWNFILLCTDIPISVLTGSFILIIILTKSLRIFSNVFELLSFNCTCASFSQFPVQLFVSMHACFLFPSNCINSDSLYLLMPTH